MTGWTGGGAGVGVEAAGVGVEAAGVAVAVAGVEVAADGLGEAIGWIFAGGRGDGLAGGAAWTTGAGFVQTAARVPKSLNGG
jgi:hypothetical protein